MASIIACILYIVTDLLNQSFIISNKTQIKGNSLQRDTKTEKTPHPEANISSSNDTVLTMI